MNSEQSNIGRENDEQPYFAIAGELVADVIVLCKMVEARRPEITAIPGTYHLTVDEQAGAIILGKLLDDGRIVLVERVLVNPQDPTRFGASELPIVVGDQTPRH